MTMTRGDSGAGQYDGRGRDAVTVTRMSLMTDSDPRWLKADESASSGKRDPSGRDSHKGATASATATTTGPLSPAACYNGGREGPSAALDEATQGMRAPLTRAERLVSLDRHGGPEGAPNLPLSRPETKGSDLPPTTSRMPDSGDDDNDHDGRVGSSPPLGICGVTVPRQEYHPLEDVSLMRLHRPVYNRAAVLPGGPNKMGGSPRIKISSLTDPSELELASGDRLLTSAWMTAFTASPRVDLRQIGSLPPT